jgi:hypothetical protein
MKEAIRPKAGSYIEQAKEITNVLRSRSVTRDSVGDGTAESGRRRLMQELESL